ncbi:MAG TPA: ABC transporter permease, partial [Stellaceae bacterium]|nr:ABC transporter permease [Stellaceae bacterium]
MWFIARRLAFSALVLWAVSAALFALVHLVPVSPARIVLGIDATPAQIAEFEHDHGLDRPIAAQYAAWLGAALRGDFGRSYVTNLPVGGQLAQDLPVTVEIVTIGFAFAVLAALPLGLVSAFWKETAIDHLARGFAVVGVSVPGFWLGLMLIAWGAVGLGWFPPGGYVPPSAGLAPHLRSIALPAFALGIYYVAILSRMTRASMVDVLGQDYIRTARALGLRRRRIVVYVLKNGLAPVVSLAAMSYGYMFGWALIIEQVFNIAGLSRALLNAIFSRDFVTVQAIVMIITIIFILANL